MEICNDDNISVSFILDVFTLVQSGRPDTFALRLLKYQAVRRIDGFQL